VRNPPLRAAFFVRPDGVAIPKAPPLTPKQRRVIFERDGAECRYCGAPLSFLRPSSLDWLTSPVRHAHVDHVVPRSRGGQNDADNLVLACVSCNESKAAD
jgi:5-methylcytosine-specific restriction endonuclease McrA